MTLAKAVYLICDGEQCPQMTGEHFANDAREARKIAKRIGWKRADGRDLCRKCANKPRREVEE